MKGFLLVVLFLPAAANADIYFELSAEQGGETYASAERSGYYYTAFTTEDEVNLGGGLKLALGIENVVGEDKDRTLSFSLGFIRRRLDASNGDADFDVITFDSIYSWLFEKHQFGAGASYHIGPEFSSDIDGFAPVKIEFDDAIGLILQYRYELTPGFHFGIRLTEMDYETDEISDDATSIGLFFVYSPE